MDRAARVGSVVEEFKGAQLGDARRSERLVRLVEELEKDWQSGFPKVFRTEAELKAFYRFINSRGFGVEAMLKPHRTATFERARAARQVVVVHDTTPIEYRLGAPRRGLGMAAGEGRQGFLAHVSLLLTAQGGPLGVGYLETWTRPRDQARSRSDKQRESERWIRGVTEVQGHCPPGGTWIHVSDAEGDFYGVLATYHQRLARFVTRAGQLDRQVDTPAGRVALREAIGSLQPKLLRTIAVCARHHPHRDAPRSKRRKYPERAARLARVAVAATTVRLPKTRYCDVDVASFDVHVVRVWELAPPQGEAPIEWVLLTSEPIRTAAQLERIVELYRLRWTIEEFFKALKSCSLESRQLESYEALCKVVALFAPLACRLLNLRALDRLAPEAEAHVAFSETELRILQLELHPHRPPARTLHEAMLDLARLGGHLRHNGAPGWLTLSRGLETLLLLSLGLSLSPRVLNYGQS